jgi:hypothetical protein
VCLFTDGLTDVYPCCRDGAGPGEPSLVADVVRMRDQPLARILDHIFDVTDGATANVPPDDRTALLVRG